jgi:OmpA-OmpF porin, OOP family
VFTNQFPRLAYAVCSRRFLTVVICFGFVVLALTANSQPVSFTKTPALGIHLAFFDFKGADNGAHFGRYMKPGLALHFQNSFSKQIDYSVTLAGSFLEFPDGKDGSLGNGKKQLLLENDFSVRARLVKTPALFNPYVLAGFGWSQYDNQYGLYSPVGLGLQVNVTPDLFLLANTQYRIPVTSLQHQHFFHSIGIAGAISRKKIVHAPPAPLPPPVVKQVIPTDVDGDGILDHLDSCPHLAGVIRYHGCPVPDRDGDGIFDEDDECIDVRGIAAYKGCPMPDKDMDGVADAEDKCPDMAGSAVNGGCPEIATLKTMINWAAQHIFFETGSYHLLPRSFPPLDSVANLLKKYPVVQLSIEGHTDSIGGVPYNQTLSENRAGAVMQYLVKAGIAASRLQATGYGLRQPIATNSTREGQAANRRVVLVLHF